MEHEVVQQALRVARERVEAEAAAVLAVRSALSEEFVRAAALIAQCPGKMFIGGSGTSGAVAHRMAHVLSVTGTPSIYFAPMDSLHGGAGAMCSDDVVLLISKSGASTEAMQCADVLRRRNVRTLSLTKSHDTPLAGRVDMSLVLDVDDAAELGGIFATGITMAQAAWGDALAEVLMRARGYTMEEFFATHPAGGVGMREELPPNLERIKLPDVTWG